MLICKTALELLWSWKQNYLSWSRTEIPVIKLRKL